MKVASACPNILPCSLSSDQPCPYPYVTSCSCVSRPPLAASPLAAAALRLRRLRRFPNTRPRPVASECHSLIYTIMPCLACRVRDWQEVEEVLGVLAARK